MKIIDGKELDGKKIIVFEDGSMRIKNEKWKPGLDEEYWYVDDMFDPCSSTWYDHEIDNLRYTYNKIFRTKKEAEFYVAFLETLQEYTFEPNWENSEQEKLYIYYVYKNKSLGVSTTYDHIYQNIYFASATDANAFIKKVGENNVKKFMFGIEKDNYND